MYTKITKSFKMKILVKAFPFFSLFNRHYFIKKIHNLGDHDQIINYSNVIHIKCSFSVQSEKEHLEIIYV